MTIPAWSYTALESYDQCPKRYFHKYILKEKEPETQQMRDGIAVHKALEERIGVRKKPLPPAMSAYEPLAGSIVNSAKAKGGKTYAELKLALRRDFTTTEFFAPDVWGRSALDVLIKYPTNTAFLGDWKTGKVREKPLQLQIAALFSFRAFPTVDKIVAANLWLQEGAMGDPYTFERKDEKDLWREIMEKLQHIETSAARNYWPEQPSGLCGWCPVSTCKFYKPRS